MVANSNQVSKSPAYDFFWIYSHRGKMTEMVKEYIELHPDKFISGKGITHVDQENFSELETKIRLVYSSFSVQSIPNDKEMVEKFNEKVGEELVTILSKLLF